MSKETKLQKAWEKLGTIDPYWSVMTNDKFKMASLTSQDKRTFFDSGKHEIEVLKQLLKRADLALPKGKCLDYGCGVGRVTIHLGGLFDSVLGVDISRPHLSLATDNAKEYGISNVAFQHIDGKGRKLLSQKDTFAFIHSVIVLQHSHPSIILAALEVFGKVLAPGGLALFQVTTHHDAYVYDTAVFDDKPFESLMELHAVRQRDVFTAMAAEDCRPMGVFEIDRVGAGWSNHYFIFSKTPPP